MITPVCPRCHSDFKREGNEFYCASCKKTYAVTEGIADLRTGSEPYWGEIPQERMRRLINDAKSSSWEKALKDICDERKNPDLHSMVVDEDRANWFYFMPLERNAAVLDVGAGWGAISFSLSRYFSEVVSLDPVLERLQFLETRRKQEKRENIQCVCGSSLHLPFKDGSFDLVVLNGVLEWVPLSEPSKNPYAVQQEALKELRRVLKPHGFLYVGIENRLGAEYLLGFVDHHSGLKYATIMPRPLANIYSRIKKGVPYRTLTHSYRGYKSLLKKAGYKDINFFFPVATYRKFYYLIPLKYDRVTEFTLTHLLPEKLIFVSPLVRKLHSLVMILFKLRMTFVLKWFISSYSIIAQKNDDQ